MIEIKGIKKYRDPNPPDGKIPDYSAICPVCGDYLTFIHDLRCPICDNKTKLWCPTCWDHYVVIIDY